MGSYFSTQSPPDKVDNNDVLGNKGRKVLDACVKVKIYGKPETRRYDGGQAMQLFRKCYVCRMREACGEFPQTGPNDAKKTYSIVDIYNAMVSMKTGPTLKYIPKDLTRRR